MPLIVLQRVQPAKGKSKFQNKVYTEAVEGLDDGWKDLTPKVFNQLPIAVQNLISPNGDDKKTSPFFTAADGSSLSNIVGYLEIYSADGSKWAIKGNGFVNKKVHEAFQGFYDDQGYIKEQQEASELKKAAQKTKAAHENRIKAGGKSSRTLSRDAAAEARAQEQEINTKGGHYRASDADSSESEASGTKDAKKHKKKKPSKKSAKPTASSDTEEETGDLAAAAAKSLTDVFAKKGKGRTQAQPKAQVPPTPHKIGAAGTLSIDADAASASAADTETVEAGEAAAPTTPTKEGALDGQPPHTLVAATAGLSEIPQDGKAQSKTGGGTGLAPVVEDDEDEDFDESPSPKYFGGRADTTAPTMTFMKDESPSASASAGGGGGGGGADESAYGAYLLLSVDDINVHLQESEGEIALDKLTHFIQSSLTTDDAKVQAPSIEHAAATGSAAGAMSHVRIRVRCRTAQEISDAGLGEVPDPTLDQMLSVLHAKGFVLAGAKALKVALVEKVTEDSIVTAAVRRMSKRHVKEETELEEAFSHISRALIGLDEEKIMAYTQPLPKQKTGIFDDGEDDEELTEVQSVEKQVKAEWDVADLPVDGHYKPLTPIMHIIIQTLLRDELAPLSDEDLRFVLDKLLQALPNQTNGFMCMRQLLRAMPSEAYNYNEAHQSFRSLVQRFVYDVYEAGKQNKALLDLSVSQAEKNAMPQARKVSEASASKADSDDDSQSKFGESESEDDADGQETAAVQTFPPLSRQHYIVFQWLVEIMVYQSARFPLDGDDTDEIHRLHLQRSIDEFKGNLPNMTGLVVKKMNLPAVNDAKSSATAAAAQSAVEVQTAREMIGLFLQHYFDDKTGQVTPALRELLEEEAAALDGEEVVDAQAEKELEQKQDEGAGAGAATPRSIGVASTAAENGSDDDDEEQDDVSQHRAPTPQPQTVPLMDLLTEQQRQDAVLKVYFDIMECQQSLSELNQKLEDRYALYQKRYQGERSHKGQAYIPKTLPSAAESDDEQARKMSADGHMSETSEELTTAASAGAPKKKNLFARIGSSVAQVLKPKQARRASSEGQAQTKEYFMDKMHQLMQQAQQWVLASQSLSTIDAFAKHVRQYHAIKNGIQALMAATNQNAKRYKAAEDKKAQEARQKKQRQEQQIQQVRKQEARVKQLKAEEKARLDLSMAPDMVSTSGIHKGDAAVASPVVKVEKQQTFVVMINKKEGTNSRLNFGYMLQDAANTNKFHGPKCSPAELGASLISYCPIVYQFLSNYVIEQEFSSKQDMIQLGLLVTVPQGCADIAKIQIGEKISFAALYQLWSLMIGGKGDGELNVPLVASAASVTTSQAGSVRTLSTGYAAEDSEEFDDTASTVTVVTHASSANKTLIRLHLKNGLCTKVIDADEDEPECGDKILDVVNTSINIKSQFVKLLQKGIKSINIYLEDLPTKLDDWTDSVLLGVITKATQALLNPSAVPSRRSSVDDASSQSTGGGAAASAQKGMFDSEDEEESDEVDDMFDSESEPEPEPKLEFKHFVVQVISGREKSGSNVTKNAEVALYGIHPATGALSQVDAVSQELQNWYAKTLPKIQKGRKSVAYFVVTHDGSKAAHGEWIEGTIDTQQSYVANASCALTVKAISKQSSASAKARLKAATAGQAQASSENAGDALSNTGSKQKR